MLFIWKREPFSIIWSHKLTNIFGYMVTQNGYFRFFLERMKGGGGGAKKMVVQEG